LGSKLNKVEHFDPKIIFILDKGPAYLGYDGNYKRALFTYRTQVMLYITESKQVSVNF